MKTLALIASLVAMFVASGAARATNPIRHPWTPPKHFVPEAIASAPWTPIVAAHADASSPWAMTEAEQMLLFGGVTPDTDYLVQFYAYHSPNDIFPYVLGTWAHSSGGGSGRAFVSQADLAVFYEGLDEGPIYKVKVCLYFADDLIRVAPVLCTPRTFDGHYPESMWYYTGTPA